ncbi:MAG TPA: Hsp20/alpha crystallin family protein [Gemmatimonadales bacterium]|jgi:HSP20 family protein|nr:Hsp20/alpha crystallin family protein [Gemmatimonadales bacterium]
MSAIIRKTPRDPMLDLLYNLERRMGRIFNEPVVFSDWSLPELASTAWVPVVDIFEEAEHIRIVAEIPGVKPENFKISVEDNMLTISGTKEQVAEEKAEKVHRYERTYGSFERSFTLPGTVDPAAIKATYEHGVLSIMLPKLEKAKAREIKVDVAPAKALKS